MTAPRPTAMRANLFTPRLFPVLDREFWLTLALAVGDPELEILGAHALLELQVRTALVVARVRALALEERHQLVLAHLEVAEVDAVHAALEQRLGFARRVQVVGHFLVVDLERQRVEREELADVHRDEHRHLGVGREQQLFLEDEQLLVEVDHVLLEVLHRLVERARVGGRLAFGRRRRGGLAVGRRRDQRADRRIRDGRVRAVGRRRRIGRGRGGALRRGGLGILREQRRREQRAHQDGRKDAVVGHARYSFRRVRNSRTYLASSLALNSRCAARSTPSRSTNTIIGSRSTWKSRPVFSGAEISSWNCTSWARANFSARAVSSSRLTPMTVRPALA